jgi:hypothetical protein
MQTTPFIQRLQAAVSALAATAVVVVPIGQASAAGDESPFGKAVQLADAELGNQRGGMAASNGQLLPFGLEVDLQSEVNGKRVAEVSIQKSKDGGFQATTQNFGRTVAVESQPSQPMQITVSQGTGGSTGSAGGQNGPTDAAPKVSQTGPVPSTTRTGNVLATTMLLSNGNGVMTLIQNGQSNVAIHAVQTLNIKLTGINADMLRNMATTNGFANALRASARR